MVSTQYHIFCLDRLTGHGESVRSTNKPQTVATLSGHFIEDIAVGAEHTLAVSSDGDVFAWGNNVDGQLGLGNTNTVRTPQLITTLSGKNIRKASITTSVRHIYIYNHRFNIKSMHN